MPQRIHVHSTIVQRMKALGYDVRTKGVCLGVSGAAVSASLSDDIAAFNERIQYLIDTQDRSDEMFIHELKELDGFYTDMFAFFDAIYINMYNPRSDRLTVAGKSIIQELTQSLQLTASVKLNDGISSLGITEALVDRDTLKQGLLALQDSLDKCSEVDYSFALTIDGHLHSTVLCCAVNSVGTCEWSYIDANLLPVKSSADVSCLADAIFVGLNMGGQKKRIALEIQCFVSQVNSIRLKPLMKQIQTAFNEANAAFMRHYSHAKPERKVLVEVGVDAPKVNFINECIAIASKALNLDCMVSMLDSALHMSDGYGRTYRQDKIKDWFKFAIKKMIRTGKLSLVDTEKHVTLLSMLEESERMKLLCFACDQLHSGSLKQLLEIFQSLGYAIDPNKILLSVSRISSDCLNYLLDEKGANPFAPYMNRTAALNAFISEDYKTMHAYTEFMEFNAVSPVYNAFIQACLSQLSFGYSVVPLKVLLTNIVHHCDSMTQLPMATRKGIFDATCSDLRVFGGVAEYLRLPIAEMERFAAGMPGVESYLVGKNESLLEGIEVCMYAAKCGHVHLLENLVMIENRLSTADRQVLLFRAESTPVDPDCLNIIKRSLGIIPLRESTFCVPEGPAEKACDAFVRGDFDAVCQFVHGFDSLMSEQDFNEFLVDCVTEVELGTVSPENLYLLMQALFTEQAGRSLITLETLTALLTAASETANPSLEDDARDIIRDCIEKVFMLRALAAFEPEIDAEGVGELLIMLVDVYADKASVYFRAWLNQGLPADSDAVHQAISHVARSNSDLANDLTEVWQTYSHRPNAATTAVAGLFAQSSLAEVVAQAQHGDVADLSMN